MNKPKPKRLKASKLRWSQIVMLARIGRDWVGIQDVGARGPSNTTLRALERLGRIEVRLEPVWRDHEAWQARLAPPADA